MTKVEKSFVINIPIYNIDLLVVFGNKDYLAKQIQEAWEKDMCDVYNEDIQDIADSTVGLTSVDIKNSRYFIWIKDEIFEDTAVVMGVLAHEIFHATAKILESVGISPSQDSEESYAYLIQYLTQSIYPDFTSCVSQQQ